MPFIKLTNTDTETLLALFEELSDDDLTAQERLTRDKISLIREAQREKHATNIRTGGTRFVRRAADTSDDIGNPPQAMTRNRS